MATPLAFLVIARVASNVEMDVCEFREVMQWLGVRQPDRYARLVALAVILLAVVMVLRVVRGEKEDE